MEKCDLFGGVFILVPWHGSNEVGFECIKYAHCRLSLRGSILRFLCTWKENDALHEWNVWNISAYIFAFVAMNVLVVFFRCAHIFWVT